MRVMFALPFLLGVLWITKGVLSLLRGHGSDYWGDDCLYGGLLLLVGIVGWLNHARRASRQAARLG